MSQQELDERRSARRAGARQPRRRRRQRRAAAPARGLQARRRAVRRRDHAPQRRRRRPDRRRQRRPGRALFLLAQTDPLRVYVNVPQSYAQLIKPGQKVVVTQAELRGRTFEGEVARTSASIDATTRTMQIEVALPNRDGTLLPGALRAGRAAAAGERGAGRSDQRAAVPRRRHARRGRRCARPRPSAPVRLGRNYRRDASKCSTASRATDQLVLNPSDSLAEGDPCRWSSPARTRNSESRSDASRCLRCALLVRVAPPGRTTAGRRSTMPVAWKVEAPWREGAPNDVAAKGPWWQRFGDPQLDALEQQALAAQSDARGGERAARAGACRRRLGDVRPVSAARLNAARRAPEDLRQPAADQLRVAELLDGAERLPRVVHASATKSISPAACSARSKARRHRPSNRPPISRTRGCCSRPIWRRAYFNLRELDIELDVLARSIDLQRRALELATARHDLGAASGLDVAQQQALLDSTLTQVDVLRKQRGQFEHAIATLTGTPAPAVLRSPRRCGRSTLPDDSARRAVGRAAAPAGRRLRGARDGRRQRADRRRHRRVLSEHHAGAGLRRSRARRWRSLFNAPSLLWSLGVSLAQPMFDAGRMRANVDFARGGYDVDRRELPARRADRDAGSRRRHHRPRRARPRDGAGAASRSRARGACWTSRPAATKAASPPTST